MIKLRPTTLDGLRRLLRSGEFDIFDLLEAVPTIIIEEEQRIQLEEHERRRLEWLERYKPNLALCVEDSSPPICEA